VSTDPPHLCPESLAERANGRFSHDRSSIELGLLRLKRLSLPMSAGMIVEAVPVAIRSKTCRPQHRQQCRGGQRNLLADAASGSRPRQR
jgi:hypothetical protein